jgi:hypothetical protein
MGGRTRKLSRQIVAGGAWLTAAAGPACMTFMTGLLALYYSKVSVVEYRY